MMKLLLALLMATGLTAISHGQPSQQPLNIWGTAPNVVVLYEHELLFIKLPADVSLGRNDRRRTALMRDTAIVDPRSLPSIKSLRFKRLFNILPAKKNYDRFLVITDMLHESNQATEGFDDFVGIISVNGDVVYQFKVKQRRPDLLVEPIAVSPDGSYAEIAIGEQVEGEDSPTVGRPRELLAWSYPSKIQRLSVPKGANPWDAIMRGYNSRKPKP